MAALFSPRFYTQPEPNFRGLFRLLEDFDQYSSNTDSRTGEVSKVFSPKFDLKETEHTYELHGELPGIDKENVTIEFTDPQTIVVRGKVERVYSSGSPSASGADHSGEENVPISGSNDKEAAAKAHKATVEDDTAEAGEGTTTTVAKSNATSSSTDVAKHDGQSTSRQKYWVSERSVGQFSRTFHFPTRVEHDTVSAALSNGILTVTVPKAKKLESKRIAIN